MKFPDRINPLTSPLARQFTLVFTGNIASAGFGFLALLVISRSLTTSDFGLFSIARSFIVIGSLFAGLGMDTGMIRFASSYLKEEKTAEASHVFRTTFLVTTLTGSVTAVILFGMSESVSVRVFHLSGLIPLIKVACIGIMALAALDYLRSVFYAYQLFQKSVIQQLLVDVLKLIGVVVLLSYLRMDVLAAVAVFAFAPLAGVLLGLGQLRHKLFPKSRPMQNLTGKLLSYSKWLFVSSVCNATLKHVGIFMLAEMVSSRAAGIYGLALNLAYIFPILMESLKSVLLPEVSRFNDMTKFERYIKRSLKSTFFIGIAIIPVLFLSNRIIPFFFGPRYLESVPVFDILLISYAVQMVNSTIRVALYSMNKPRIIAMLDIIRLVVMIVGCYFVIPLIGTIAPAVVTLILNISILGVLSLYAVKEIRKNSLTFQEEGAVEPFGNSSFMQ